MQLFKMPQADPHAKLCPSVPHRTAPPACSPLTLPSILMQLFKKLKKANNPDKIHAMVKEVTASLKEAKGWVLHQGGHGEGG